MFVPRVFILIGAWLLISWAQVLGARAASQATIGLSGGYAESPKFISHTGAGVLHDTISTGTDPQSGGGGTLDGDVYGGRASIVGLSMHSSGYASGGSEFIEFIGLGIGETMAWNDTVRVEFSADDVFDALNSYYWASFDVGWDLSPGSGSSSFTFSVESPRRSKSSQYQSDSGFTVDDFRLQNGVNAESRVLGFSAQWDQVTPLAGNQYLGTIDLSVFASAGATTKGGNSAAAIDVQYLNQKVIFNRIIDEDDDTDDDEAEIIAAAASLSVTNTESDSGYDYANAVMPGTSLAGDYNSNGDVDAADYTTWRDTLGQSEALPNDATPGVDAGDYGVWKTHFGESIFDGGEASLQGTALLPEPNVLFLVAPGLGLFRRRR